jgi:hypothetical protein
MLRTFMSRSSYQSTKGDNLISEAALGSSGDPEIENTERRKFLQAISVLEGPSARK